MSQAGIAPLQLLDEQLTPELVRGSHDAAPAITETTGGVLKRQTTRSGGGCSRGGGARVQEKSSTACRKTQILVHLLQTCGSDGVTLGWVAYFSGAGLSLYLCSMLSRLIFCAYLYFSTLLKIIGGFRFKTLNKDSIR